MRLRLCASFGVFQVLALSSILLGLEGKVITLDGSPVADATVSVIGQAGTATTDRDGFFRWTPDPPLPFEVLVVLANGQYMAPFLVREIPRSGPVVIRVEPVTHDEVFVTGDVAPHIEATQASGLALIQQEEILSGSPPRLVDAIEMIPGVSRASEGHAVVPAIRGLTGGRTLVLIDGGRVTTERRAGPSATYLDPFFLEAIEVSRGPGSVAYGSDAFGGVVDAITRSPEPGAPWSFRFQGRVAAGLPERGAGLELVKGWREGGGLLQSSFRHFDDFHSPLGIQDNSSARNRSFLGKLVQEVGPGLLVLGFQNDQGNDIGRPRNNSASTRFFYPLERSKRFTTTYTLDPRWGFSRIKFDFFAGSYRLQTTRDEIPTASSPRSITISDIAAKDYGFRALFVKPLGAARVEMGVDFNGRFDLEALELAEDYDFSDRLVTSRRELAIENAHKNDAAIYASSEIQLAGPVTIGGGLRLDGVTTHNRGGVFQDRETAETALSGFASITLTPVEDLGITAQFSRGFRDPLLSDRYFAGLTGRGFITGNPDLDPESSKQFDLAVRYASGPFRWRVFFYHYRIEDLIERYESGSDLFLFRNRGKATIRGLETEIEWRLRPTLSASLGAQLSRGRALDNRQPLDNIPVQNLVLSLLKTLGGKGYLEGHVLLYDRDTRPGPTERVDPGRGIVHLGAGWKFESNFDLRFHIRNLFDKDYLISPDSRAIPAPGRNAGLTLSLSL